MLHANQGYRESYINHVTLYFFSGSLPGLAANTTMSTAKVRYEGITVGLIGNPFVKEMSARCFKRTVAN